MPESSDGHGDPGGTPPGGDGGAADSSGGTDTGHERDGEAPHGGQDGKSSQTEAGQADSDPGALARTGSSDHTASMLAGAGALAALGGGAVWFSRRKAS